MVTDRVAMVTTAVLVLIGQVSKWEGHSLHAAAAAAAAVCVGVLGWGGWGGWVWVSGSNG